ncbi:MAG: hypothetical protein M3Q56_04260 [Bacteroidota bacterium]|nr:hypothetical protein [Bacteroidota bacterium]
MENLKQRILTGWTFIRILYVGLGTTVIIISAMSQQWFGILFGAYFASMGLFSFGCAAGGCFGGNCNTPQIQQNKTQMQDVEFEEVEKK